MSDQDFLGTPDQAASAALNPQDNSASSNFSAVPPQPAAQPAQQTTSPTATPAYPPSPDQPGGQNPIANTSDDTTAAAPSKHSLWRSVIVGALSGIESHLAGAAKGALAGGIPGSIVGLANPQMADRALTQQQAVRSAQVRSAIDDVQFARDNHDVAMAQAQIHLAELNKQFNSMPEDFQAHLLQEGAEAGQHLMESGIPPVYSTRNEEDADRQVRARMQTNADNPVGVIKMPDGRGGWNVFEIPNNNKLIGHDVDVTVGFGLDDKPITRTYRANTITVGQRFALESAAMVDQARQHLQRVKNEGSANTASIRANASAAGNSLKNAQLFEGTDANNNQVAGTPDELKAAGVSQFVKMPALTQTQTLAARELTSTDGLFAQAKNQILTLNKAGQLGPVASRWNNFWAKKGLNGDQQAFRDTLGLIATKLMQAHLGNRGGKDALEHFSGLVPEGSTPDALMKELNTEYQYVNSLAKRPKKGGQ